MKISNFSIIEFSISITVDNELEFRNYRYVTVWIIVALQTPVKAVTDSECVVFLIDETYFRQILFAKKFIKMTVFINVRKIENVFRENDFYLFLNLYLNEIFRDSSTREYFRKKIHIVNDLKCKIFLNMNILKTKQMTFNMKNKIMILFTCKNLIVLIRITSKSNARIRRVIQFKNQTVISVKAVTQMFIYFKKKRLSDDKNYFFKSDQKQLAIVLNEMNDFYVHVCEENLICVQIKNDRNVTVKISRKIRFDTLTKYEKKEYYQLNKTYHDVAIIISVKQMKIWFENLNNYETFHDTENSKFIFENFFFSKLLNNHLRNHKSFDSKSSSDRKSNVFKNHDDRKIDLKSAKSRKKIVLWNDITMFDDFEIKKKLKTMIFRWKNLWNEKDSIVKISKSAHMPINLKSNWIDHHKINRVYFVDVKNQKFIDEIFDKLHKQNKMKWSNSSIFFDYSVFVVWKTVIKNEKFVRKNRIVVNIRNLNQISQIDVYSMFVQTDIIAAVFECFHIFIIDAQNYFYQ